MRVVLWFFLVVGVFNSSAQAEEGEGWIRREMRETYKMLC